MLIRVLAAGGAGAVALFLGGFVIFGLLLRSYFDETMTATARSVMRAEPDFVALIIAQIVLGLLLAFIFAYWASISTFVGGLRGGAIVMGGIGLAMGLERLAFFQDLHTGSPYIPLLVHVIAAAVLGAIGGGVIGQVLG